MPRSYVKAPRRPIVGQGTENVTTYYDGFRRRYVPNNERLVQEYKRTVFACANLNAEAVASTPLKLYLRKTNNGEKSLLQCGIHTKKLTSKEIDKLAARADLRKTLRSFIDLEEVVVHPSLDLLHRVNHTPFLNGYLLSIYTQLYQDITGISYWVIEREPLFGTPYNIWLLPSQYVEPVKEDDSKSSKVIDYYSYFPPGVAKEIRYKPEDLIVFKMSSLQNPYVEGVGFLEAAFESNEIDSKLVSLEHGLLHNEGRPDLIIAPKGDAAFGPDEARRFEKEYQLRFGRGRQGGMWVLEDDVSITPINIPARDLARLEINKWSKNDIANAAQVPFALIADASHNRQQLEAAEVQHARHGVRPRCCRNVAVLNDQFLPLYDETGSLFFAYDDPVPEDKTQKLQENIQLGMNGFKTPNEIREEYNLPPIEGGDELRAINVSPEIMRQNERDSGSAEK